MSKKDIYFATVCWDGIDEWTDGEQTIVRYSIDDLLEGVAEYLELFQPRGAYLECASMETYTEHGGGKVEKWREITESVKTILKIKENNGKKT